VRLRIILAFNIALIYYTQDFRVYEGTRDQPMPGPFPADPFFKGKALGTRLRDSKKIFKKLQHAANWKARCRADPENSETGHRNIFQLYILFISLRIFWKTIENITEKMVTTVSSALPGSTPIEGQSPLRCPPLVKSVKYNGMVTNFSKPGDTMLLIQ